MLKLLNRLKKAYVVKKGGLCLPRPMDTVYGAGRIYTAIMRHGDTLLKKPGAYILPGVLIAMRRFVINNRAAVHVNLGVSYYRTGPTAKAKKTGVVVLPAALKEE